jgi:FkbM family methyltransferase
VSSLARLTRFVKRQKAVRLAQQALARRRHRLGLAPLFKHTIPPASRVVYLDAGLHKSAAQLRLVADWFGGRCDLRLYGFEAHPDYLRSAGEAARGIAGLCLVNVALVGPEQGHFVTLYLNGASGIGNSLVRRHGSQSIEVPAVRLSDFLVREGIDPRRDITILRMNIEGAEAYVLEDLLAAGLISFVDGFYGAWDDPRKIGGKIAERFDAAMERARVKNFRFNDKDCRSKLRLAIIRYDLTTSILAGALAKTAS